MRWNRRFSIYYKINTIIVSMLLLLSLTIAIIMVETTGVLLDQQIEKRGSEVASNIAVLSSNDILLDDHYSLSDRINRTKSNMEDIRYILVTDSLGRVIAHTFPGNLPIGLPLTLPSIKVIDPNPFGVPHLDDTQVSNTSPYQVSKFNSNEGPIREIAVPIESGIGFVRVGMSEKSTQQLLAEKTGEFFYITLMSCFLAVIASTYLARIIIKPIGILVQAAQEIRKGNCRTILVNIHGVANSHGQISLLVCTQILPGIVEFAAQAALFLMVDRTILLVPFSSHLKDDEHQNHLADGINCIKQLLILFKIKIIVVLG
jgi:hypothetical protein